MSVASFRTQRRCSTLSVHERLDIASHPIRVQASFFLLTFQSPQSGSYKRQSPQISVSYFLCFPPKLAFNGLRKCLDGCSMGDCENLPAFSVLLELGSHHFLLLFPWLPGPHCFMSSGDSVPTHASPHFPLLPPKPRP